VPAPTLRFLTPRWWFRSHPFSLSAAPDGRSLRFTVKALGDHTASLQRLRPGTRVALEGPYGTMTTSARTSDRMVLVAGGIGITPLRAVLEALPPGPGGTVLLYRASRPEDLVFRGEIEALARGPRRARPLPGGMLDRPRRPRRAVHPCGPLDCKASGEARLSSISRSPDTSVGAVVAVVDYWSRPFSVPAVT
jgi:hypothetical protein